MSKRLFLLLCMFVTLTVIAAQCGGPTPAPKNYTAQEEESAGEEPAVVEESATGEEPAVVEESATEEESTSIPTSPPATTDPVETLLSQMSLPEKVGQLFAVFFYGTHMSDSLRTHIVEGHVGTIILFAPNVESPAQVRELTNQAQEVAVSNGAGIPLLISTDQEGWPIARLSEDLGFNSLLSNMALGATDSEDDARQAAAIIATEMKSVGLNMNLAPVVDVNNNPANPIIGWRSFGADPELVSRLGVAQIEGYQANGIIATAKHFPGHGDTGTDSHVALPTVPHARDRLDAVELAPFRAAIAAGVSVIMTAHITFPEIDPTPGLPATLSRPILTGLLREELGFEGVIATDSLGMDAVEQTFGLTQTTVMALDAGADMLMFGADRGHSPMEAHQVYRHILALVESGEIPESRIDESVRRILRLKADYGLLEWQPNQTSEITDTDAQAQLLEIAQHSVTIVQDEAGLLPLHSTENLLFIYPDVISEVVEILQAKQESAGWLAVGLDPSTGDIQTATQRVASYDKIVIFTANTTRHPDQATLVRTIVDTGQPVVVVALALPYDSALLPESISYVATYGFSRVMLTSMADVLFGVIPARGKLPVR